jgi:hypothetical protein
MRVLPSYATARTVLTIAVAALAACSFGLAAFLPVYTDEIVWKALQGRMGIDGGSLALTFQPSCGPYVFAVPALLYPFRLLDGALYRVLADPLAIRALGVVLALAWLALAAALASSLCREREGRITAVAVLLGFATLGVMPFFLVVSRPEQILLIGITCLFVPLLRPAAGVVPTPARCGVRAAGGVVLAAFVLAAHPKAIFAVPLMLAFLWRAARRPGIAAVASAAVVIFAAVSYRDWSARWACPGDPHFASLLFPINLGSALEQGRLLGYLTTLGDALGYASTWYLGQFTPNAYYTSNLLPPFDHPALASAMRILFGIFVAEGFLAFLLALASRPRRPQVLSFIAVAALWLFYLACVATRITKNHYEAELMEPVMAMAALGSLWLAWPPLARAAGETRALAAAHAGVIALLVLSAASQALLIANYAPYARGAWQEPGYPPGQDFSLSIFGYGPLVARMEAAARLCGIDPAARNEHLVVDELTSFAFRDAYQPFFVTFFEGGWGAFRPDPSGLWRDQHSAGMIVGCTRVPPAFADKVTRSGGFCCLPSFAAS